MQYQVVIIGGGPSGSTAATLLAKEGFKVLLLEKEAFPRYHIGESGILALPGILQFLGIEEKIKAHGFKKKGGVYFDWNEKWIVNWQIEGQYSYHVERSLFDSILLDHAKESGAEVIQKASVLEIFFEKERPTSLEYLYEGEKRRVSFDYLIDASGRSAIMARKYLKSQRFLSAFRNVAVWGYWLFHKDPNELKNFKKLREDPNPIEAPIVLSSVSEGWIWGIPLQNQALSVGLVHYQTQFDEKRKKGLTKDQIYYQGLQESDVFMEILEKGALMSPLHFTSDWSYHTTQWSGPGYFLVGDAAVFIDPLLSTGMTSGMMSALSCAASIASLLRKEVQEEAAHRFYKEDSSRRFWRFAFLISTLYSAKVPKEELFHKAHHLTSRDLETETLQELQRSFSQLIGGMTDYSEMSLYELQRISADRLRENFYHFFPIIPKVDLEAKAGLEVLFNPRIGLGSTRSVVN